MSSTVDYQISKRISGLDEPLVGVKQAWLPAAISPVFTPRLFAASPLGHHYPPAATARPWTRHYGESDRTWALVIGALLFAVVSPRFIFTSAGVSTPKVKTNDRECHGILDHGWHRPRALSGTGLLLVMLVSEAGSHVRYTCITVFASLTAHQRS